MWRVRAASMRERILRSSRLIFGRPCRRRCVQGAGVGGAGLSIARHLRQLRQAAWACPGMWRVRVASERERSLSTSRLLFRTRCRRGALHEGCRGENSTIARQLREQRQLAWESSDMWRVRAACRRERILRSSRLIFGRPCRRRCVQGAGMEVPARLSPGSSASCAKPPGRALVCGECGRHPGGSFP